MAKHIVIDADGHCYEPDSELAKYMPKEMAHLAPNRVTDSSGYSHLMIEGRLAGRRRWGGGADRGSVFADHIERSRPGMTDAVKRLPDMDEEGIDVAVIFGTSIALMVNGMADKPLAAAVCHAVNRWLVEEYLVVDPKRLKGVGLIPIQDPIAAVKELEFLAKQSSIVTAMLPTNVYGINLGHRMFDPVYAAAEGIGMPLSVHPQTEHDGQYGVWGVMGDFISVRTDDRAHAYDRRRRVRPLSQTQSRIYGRRLRLGTLLGGETGRTLREIASTVAAAQAQTFGNHP
jgi:predicted TIM-barrel fold metal-dependent hydrolase